MIPTRIDKKTVQKGLTVFFGFSIVSLALVFVFTQSERTFDALSEVRPVFLLMAVVLSALDWVGGGLRLYVLTRGLSRHIPFRAGVKAALANVSMGAITPSQSGGAPALIYILHKYGLPFAEAMSAGLMTFIVTILFFVSSALAITVLGINTSITNETVRMLFQYGVGTFLVIGLVILLFVSKPALLRAFITALFNFLSRFRRQHLLRPGGRAHRIIEVTDECHEINRHYFRNRFPALLWSFVITACLFSAKCFVAYFIVLGLGVQAAVWEVASLQILILLTIYFFPTPGGAGAAELGSAVLMASILPVELLPVYVVLWRLVMMYFPVIIGSGMMLRELGSEGYLSTERNYPGVEKKIAVSGE